MIRRSRSDIVEELKRFACKIEARGRKEKKRIVDEKTLFVCESCGQFLSLPFERDRGERSSSWGRERSGKRTISISSPRRRPNYTQVVPLMERDTAKDRLKNPYPD